MVCANRERERERASKKSEVPDDSTRHFIAKGGRGILGISLNTKQRQPFFSIYKYVQYVHKKTEER